jgi:hypothetical protein
MNDFSDRRQFLRTTGLGLGSMALASLGLGSESMATFAPKAKRVIYLFMHGGPSQLDLFDHKPGLAKHHGHELPASVRGKQRLTGMTSGQASLPVAASRFSFARHGRSGAWVSELLPHTAGIVDELCLIRSMHTEAINHDPAVTYSADRPPAAGPPQLSGRGSATGSAAKAATCPPSS